MVTNVLSFQWARYYVSEEPITRNLRWYTSMKSQHLTTLNQLDPIKKSLCQSNKSFSSGEATLDRRNHVLFALIATKREAHVVFRVDILQIALVVLSQLRCSRYNCMSASLAVGICIAVATAATKLLFWNWRIQFLLLRSKVRNLDENMCEDINFTFFSWSTFIKLTLQASTPSYEHGHIKIMYLNMKKKKKERFYSCYFKPFN